MIIGFAFIPLVDVPIYDVPKTAEHPFGDEHFSNMNMLDNDTNLLHCNERKESELAKLNGKCPLNEEDSRLMVRDDLFVKV